MKYLPLTVALSATLILAVQGCYLKKSNDVIVPNPIYEKQTVIKKSRIPGAGNGLFAVMKIKKGKIIGEYGGKMMEKGKYPDDSSYIASIPECAHEKSKPYVKIDGKFTDSHVTRINFAPRKINGIDTNFQNARLKGLCKYPYVIFLAQQDINPGDEILASYGGYYNYDRFIKKEPVKAYFCNRLRKRLGKKLPDCESRFEYKY